MTSNHHAPYVLGYTCYNGRYSKKQNREVEQISKTGPSSDCRLKPACTKPELLVIVDQNATVNAFPGLVHTARHTMEVGGCPKPVEGNMLSKGKTNDWGEVVTR